MDNLSLTDHEISVCEKLTPEELTSLHLLGASMAALNVTFSSDSEVCLNMGDTQLWGSPASHITGGHVQELANRFLNKPKQGNLRDKEKAALGRLIDALKIAGWKPFSCHDGGDQAERIDETWDTDKVVDALAAVDTALLLVRGAMPDGTWASRSLLLVWGNSVEELIADSSSCPTFDPILDAAMTIAGMREPD